MAIVPYCFGLLPQISAPIFLVTFTFTWGITPFIAAAIDLIFWIYIAVVDFEVLHVTSDLPFSCTVSAEWRYMGVIWELYGWCV